MSWTDLKYWMFEVLNIVRDWVSRHIKLPNSSDGSQYSVALFVFVSFPFLQWDSVCGREGD